MTLLLSHIEVLPVESNILQSSLLFLKSVQHRVAAVTQVKITVCRSFHSSTLLMKYSLSSSHIPPFNRVNLCFSPYSGRYVMTDHGKRTKAFATTFHDAPHRLRNDFLGRSNCYRNDSTPFGNLVYFISLQR